MNSTIPRPPSSALPDTLSGLLEVALRDLEAVEADPNYRVNMQVWHQFSESTLCCEVCLAGAVMAKSLGLPPDGRTGDMGLWETEERKHLLSLERKLNALDSLRKGQVWTAYYMMLGADVPVGLHHLTREIPTYSANPDAFKAAMRQLLADLKGAGL